MSRFTKWDGSFSGFIVRVLYCLIILSIGLVCLQATAWKILVLPDWLVNVADVFPGPRAKIESMVTRGYEEAASKFRSYLTVQLLLLVAALAVSVPYVIFKRVYVKHDQEWYQVATLLLLFLCLGSWFLFFRSEVEFDGDTSYFWPYDIHLSVMGYMLDVMGALLLYFSLVLSPIFYNGLQYRTEEGPHFEK